MGIAREGEGLGAKVLRESGLDDNLLTELVERYVGRGVSERPFRAYSASEAGHRACHGGREPSWPQLCGYGTSADGDTPRAGERGRQIVMAAGVDLNKLYTDIMNGFGSPEYRSKPSQPAGRASSARRPRQRPGPVCQGFDRPCHGRAIGPCQSAARRRSRESSRYSRGARRTTPCS